MQAYSQSPLMMILTILKAMSPINTPIAVSAILSGLSSSSIMCDSFLFELKVNLFEVGYVHR